MSNIGDSGVSSFGTSNVNKDVSSKVSSEEVKNGNQNLVDEEVSTDEIIQELVKVFPAGLPAGVVVNKLMATYHIDRATAEECYNSAAAQVGDEKDVTKSDLQDDPNSVSDNEDKKTAMDNLNAWGAYQKTLFDTQSSKDTKKSEEEEKEDELSAGDSASTQGGD